MGAAYDDVKESFAFHVERDVLYNDCSGYNLVVINRARSGRSDGGIFVRQGWGASGGREIRRIIIWGKRAIILGSDWVIEPLLRAGSAWTSGQIERTYGRKTTSAGLILERRLVQ